MFGKITLKIVFFFWAEMTYQATICKKPPSSLEQANLIIGAKAQIFLSPDELRTIGLNQHFRQFQVHKQTLLGTKRHHQCFRIWQDLQGGPCLASFPANLSISFLILPQKQISHPVLVPVEHKFHSFDMPFFS